ncbi:MAG: hypothetical protein GYA36_21175 [Veillonellaceae bacterium]|nr:hypothetical protein [Veillonellaceae bacterium]
MLVTLLALAALAGCDDDRPAAATGPLRYVVFWLGADGQPRGCLVSAYAVAPIARTLSARVGEIVTGNWDGPEPGGMLVVRGRWVVLDLQTGGLRTG